MDRDLNYSKIDFIGLGRPVIFGTRISVRDIIASYNVILDAMIIDEMRRRWYPHLTEEQVRAALDYYRDHPEEIDAQLREDRHFRQHNEFALAE